MTTLQSPTREQIIALMNRHNLSRPKFGELVGVARTTVDQWLASDAAVRRSKMPLGLFKLARMELGEID